MNADTAGTAHERSLAAAFAALVVGACAMGASPIFVRLADVGPQASAFWRTALALPALWLWMRIEERSARSVAPLRFDRAIALAGLCFAGDLFFWHLAILNTTVANATFFAVTAPVFVVAGAFLFLGERATSRVLLGIAACLAGGTALIAQSYQIEPARLSGDFYGIVTALFFGSYVIAVRNARSRHGAARLMFLSTIVTAALLLSAALVIEQPLAPRSLEGAAALLALALVSQVGGQGLLAFALGSLPATFSSLVIFLEAVAAAALGWIALGETLTPIQALGGLLIVVGIFIARPRATMPAGAAP
ncbi:MAG TPA: DMT family transporter [Xanthobacteraceae bacterium]|jgi:drug/metabolite transporter (DMT)-like permease